jgi:hypothetical protein
MGTRERFFSKIRGDSSGCWNWTGFRILSGYGKFYFDGAVGYAHRYSYMTFRGEIPDTLQIDHLCRNRSCVNPFHLEAVTVSENALRSPFKDRCGAIHRAKTHCPAGHPYSGHNLFIDKKGARNCRKCRNALRVRQARAARQRAVQNP